MTENLENTKYKSNDFIGDVSGISFAKDVGCYIVNENLMFYFQKKPNFIHRFFSKLLLGWVWKDN